MTRRLLVAGVALILLVVAIAMIQRLRPRSDAGAPESPVRVTADARAPVGIRVQVEVLNGTMTRGLARRATRQLRDAGFDVVLIGTSRTPADSTRVIVRTGHADWAQRAARAIGGAAISVERDTLRYVDLTIVLGATYRPPPDALDP